MGNQAIITPINKKMYKIDGTLEYDNWGIEISDDNAYAQTCIFSKDEILGVDPSVLLDIAENRTNGIAAKIIRRARREDSGVIIGRQWFEFADLEAAAGPKI